MKGQHDINTGKQDVERMRRGLASRIESILKNKLDREAYTVKLRVEGEEDKNTDNNKMWKE